MPCRKEHGSKVFRTRPNCSSTIAIAHREDPRFGPGRVDPAKFVFHRLVAIDRLKAMAGLMGYCHRQEHGHNDLAILDATTSPRPPVALVHILPPNPPLPRQLGASESDSPHRALPPANRLARSRPYKTSASSAGEEQRCVGRVPKPVP